jgi:hypothetical protein
MLEKKLKVLHVFGFHRNIVKMYGITKPSKRIVMEYCPWDLYLAILTADSPPSVLDRIDGHWIFVGVSFACTAPVEVMETSSLKMF